MGTPSAEVVLFRHTSSLHLFRDGKWEIGGEGEGAVLRNTSTGSVRFVFRESTAREVLADHEIVEHESHCNLRPNAGSDRCWAWTIIDDNKPEPSTKYFALKFDRSEDATLFKGAFDQGKLLNSEAGGFPQDVRYYSQRSQLNVLQDSEWKVRYTGEARFSRHSKTGRTFFLFWHSKTRRLVACHLVAEDSELCNLKMNAGAVDCWVWTAHNLLKGSGQRQTYALKFDKIDNAALFHATFNHAKEVNRAFSNFPGETILYSQSVALYRFSGDLGEWKVRAMGDAKMLHRVGTASCRLILCSHRHQVSMNHVIDFQDANCNVRTNAGQSTCLAWKAMDLSGEHPRLEHFAIKFKSSSGAQHFIAAFQTAKELSAGPNRLPQEEEVYRQRARLFHFRGEAWQAHDWGDAKLYRNRELGSTRFVFVAEKTSCRFANHRVVSEGGHCKLKLNTGSDHTWAWSAQVVPGAKPERFALSLCTAEVATDFKAAFEKCMTTPFAVADEQSASTEKPVSATEQQVQTVSTNSLGAAIDEIQRSSSPTLEVLSSEDAPHREEEEVPPARIRSRSPLRLKGRDGYDDLPAPQTGTWSSPSFSYAPRRRIPMRFPQQESMGAPPQFGGVKSSSSVSLLPAQPKRRGKW